MSCPFQDFPASSDTVSKKEIRALNRALSHGGMIIPSQMMDKFKFIQVSETHDGPESRRVIIKQQKENIYGYEGLGGKCRHWQSP